MTRFPSPAALGLMAALLVAAAPAGAAGPSTGEIVAAPAAIRDFMIESIDRAKAPERMQLVEALPRHADGSVRIEILQLIAMNQLDQLDMLLMEDALGNIQRHFLLRARGWCARVRGVSHLTVRQVPEHGAFGPTQTDAKRRGQIRYPPQTPSNLRVCARPRRFRFPPPPPIFSSEERAPVRRIRDTHPRPNDYFTRARRTPSLRR